jgi:hypothetical protein
MGGHDAFVRTDLSMWVITNNFFWNKGKFKYILTDQGESPFSMLYKLTFLNNTYDNKVYIITS